MHEFRSEIVPLNGHGQFCPENNVKVLTRMSEVESGGWEFFQDHFVTIRRNDYPDVFKEHHIKEDYASAMHLIFRRETTRALPVPHRPGLSDTYDTSVAGRLKADYPTAAYEAFYDNLKHNNERHLKVMAKEAKGEFVNTNRPVAVPAANHLVLTAIPRADIDIMEDVPEMMRGEVTIICDPAFVLSDLMRSVGTNVEFGNGKFQIPVRGVLSPRPGTYFHQIISSNAPEPVKIRRKSWPITMMASYINYDGNLSFSCWDRPVGDNRDRACTLTPIDLAADDWFIVSNPNIKEEECEVGEIELFDDDPEMPLPSEKS